MVGSLALAVMLGVAPDAANAGSNDGFYAQGELSPWLGAVRFFPGGSGGVGMVQGAVHLGVGIPLPQQHRLSFSASWRGGFAFTVRGLSLAPALFATTLQLRVGDGVLLPSLGVFTFGNPVVGIAPGLGYRVAIDKWLLGANLSGDFALVSSPTYGFHAMGDGLDLDGRGLRWGARAAFTAEHFFDARWSVAFVGFGKVSEHFNINQFYWDDPPSEDAFVKLDARARVVGSVAFTPHVGMSSAPASAHASTGVHR